MQKTFVTTVGTTWSKLTSPSTWQSGVKAFTRVACSTNTVMVSLDAAPATDPPVLATGVLHNIGLTDLSTLYLKGSGAGTVVVVTVDLQ